MAKVVLARVLETMGMTERTAKTFSTKIANKQEIEKDEKGWVSVEDAIAGLKAQYDKEETSSKYKEAALVAIKELEEGKIKDEWNVEITFTPKKDVFLDAKVLTAVKEYLVDNKTINLATIEKITTKIVAEKAAAKA